MGSTLGQAPAPKRSGSVLVDCADGEAVRIAPARRTGASGHVGRRERARNRLGRWTWLVTPDEAQRFRLTERVEHWERESALAGLRGDGQLQLRTVSAGGYR